MPETRRSRIITRIAITWHYEDDPATPHTDTLTNQSGGEEVDGLIWNPALMNRLRYDDGGNCRKPERRQGKGQWKVRGNPGGTTSGSGTNALSAESNGAGDSDCYYVHEPDCGWTLYCPDTIA